MYRPSLHQQHQEPPKQQFQLALRYAQPGLAQPNLPPPPPGFMYMPAQTFLQGSVQGTVQNPVPSELALHHYNIQTPVSPVSPLHVNPNGSQGQTVSSTSAMASFLVNPGGHSGFGQSQTMFGSASPNTPEAVTSLPWDSVTSTKNPEQEMTQGDAPCFYQIQLSEKDFYSPTIQQFLKNLDKSVSLLPSPSLSEKTEHSDQRTPATPATTVTPVGTSEVTVGKIPKSRKQLQMEPFIPPSSVKKEIVSDESNNDDVRILKSAATTDQQTKPRKLTPEEANGQTLTDGLAFYFISLEIKVNQL